MGSIGTVSNDTGYKMGGSYNESFEDRVERGIKQQVSNLDNVFTKTATRNGAGIVTGNRYRLDLGNNTELRITEKKVGKSTYITGEAIVPSSNPSMKYDTVYRDNFRSVEEAKKRLKEEMKKYLLG